MRIAFDLDNTLIQNEYLFDVENPKYFLFAKILSFEKLRKGTKELFDYCQNQGWETWIYTTSYRNTFYIRKMFWLYGISLHGVVNQEVHNQKVKVRSSKYPPTFGIDVLIDDSEGVKIESEKLNFTVLHLQPTNENWVEDLKIQLLNFTKHNSN